MVVRFMQLFAGSETSHGVQSHKEGGAIDHHTVDGPATLEDYEAHLAGERGLGLVPVRPDGTVIFAAIDLDVDTINHALLRAKIIELKMALNTARSKSGGAHLYMFIKAPGGFKAAKVVTVLKRWAGILGYPNAEIFPKQIRVGKSNRGNWINLPYFDAENTTRYGVGPEGAQTLEEFMDNLVYWDGNDTVTMASDVLPILGQGTGSNTVGPQMPPCLGTLMEKGIPEGQRNQAMFNFACFYRRAYPNNWEEQFLTLNQKICQPPLPGSEISRILKSVGGTKYAYKCEQSPILELCNRQVCANLPFGFQYQPWKDENNLGDIVISHLRKVDTDPPQFIVEINGTDITLSNDEFYSYEALSTRVEDILDIVVPTMKPDQWKTKRQELHTAQELIEAPDDASEKGSIMNSVMDFLTQFKNSQTAEDLLKGTPVEHNEFVCFRAADLQKYLKLHRRQFMDNNALFTLLKSYGAEFKAAKIKGRTIKVWMFPIEKLNIQTEDFTPVNFDVVAEEM